MSCTSVPHERGRRSSCGLQMHVKWLLNKHRASRHGRRLRGRPAARRPALGTSAPQEGTFPWSPGGLLTGALLPSLLARTSLLEPPPAWTRRWDLRVTPQSLPGPRCGLMELIHLLGRTPRRLPHLHLSQHLGEAPVTEPSLPGTAQPSPAAQGGVGPARSPDPGEQVPWPQRPHLPNQSCRFPDASNPSGRGSTACGVLG